LGLDSVELIFAIEAAFDVTITDAEASRLRTLGDIHQLLVAKLAPSNPLPDERAVWERLCDVVVAEQGVPRKKLTPTAEIGRDLGID
jgi:hypothetical protein